ncbi:hypothetical protein MRX96_000876 [Rhipicephalus microplus]
MTRHVRDRYFTTILAAFSFRRIFFSHKHFLVGTAESQLHKTSTTEGAVPIKHSATVTGISINLAKLLVPEGAGLVRITLQALVYKQNVANYNASLITCIPQ